MLIMLGTFRIPVASLEAARPAMAAIIAASRAEPGCLYYSFGEDPVDIGLIHVTERWADIDALTFHRGTDHMAAWRRVWPALGIGERDLLAFDSGEGRPI